jgi:HD-GYP domain-containing protein (c-di-GMP phosphodiesterase class II)
LTLAIGDNKSREAKVSFYASLPERKADCHMISRKPVNTGRRIVRVQPHVGPITSSQNLYLPLRPAFIVPSEPLPFALYWRTEQDRLRVILHKNEEFTHLLRQDFLERGETAGIFYVRSDDKALLVRYLDDHLKHLLDQDTVSTDEKCVLIQMLTTMVSQALLENPGAENVFRQRRNIYRMVDFTLHDSTALNGLLRLTHHDYNSYTHSVNVGLYALAIATAHFGQGGKHNLHELALAFFLHDIGKCFIPPEIINKPGKLTDSEWQEMRMHPIYGQQILERENVLTRELSLVVLQHHERMDGSGYPRNLRGEDIHVYARICAIADSFDSMTSEHIYKNALTPFEALNKLKTESIIAYDPEIFKTFVLMMSKSDDTKYDL